ncbi:MAG: D-alanyl-D-alanine dipeptidase [Alphaproteobacteria bacterium]|nr:D-alanyl-D-alanine dipeptidase [Alphaproteobacteria bacterium]
MLLAEIALPAFDVELALAYATEKNLTGRPIYQRAACYLHPDAASALQKAIGLAAAIDLKLKIFDGYRPTEAQWVFWRFRPDPNYFTDPRRGSPHSRGVAIDLTLIRARDGVDLDMGTGFDALTPRSHHGSLEVSGEARRNRLLLLGLMSTAGFDFYGNEWWHYQLFNPRRYPLLSDSAAGTHLMTPAPR